MTTAQFKMKPDSFKHIRSKALLKVLPALVAVVVAAIGMQYLNNNGQPLDVSFYAYMIPIFIGLLAFGVFLGFKQQKKIFGSYRLLFSNDTVTREQHNTPTVSIPYNEVAAILKGNEGSYIIKGKTATEVIIVPAYMEDQEELAQKLAAIGPVTNNTGKTFLQKYSLLLILLVLGLMVALYTSQNKVVVGVSGTVLFFYLGYNFYQVRSSKNLDFKSKRSMWWSVLIMASILGIMYSKLST